MRWRECVIHAQPAFIPSRSVARPQTHKPLPFRLSLAPPPFQPFPASTHAKPSVTHFERHSREKEPLTQPCPVSQVPTVPLTVTRTVPLIEPPTVPPDRTSDRNPDSTPNRTPRPYLAP
eukprot:65329-Chlamydomonas_euryale.AAC.1